MKGVHSLLSVAMGFEDLFRSTSFFSDPLIHEYYLGRNT